MSRISRLRVSLAGLLLAFASHATFASVVLTGTRVIYPAAEREVTVRLSNEGKAPALVQAWIDDGDPNASPDESKSPFLITPPLFRLDPQKGQSLRIIHLQQPLPADRESIFFLNVLEVPPMGSSNADTPQNSLQLAFRSRVKLFFRPTDLKGDADSAPAKVTWRFIRNAEGKHVLAATNPTPYHITFTRVEATHGASTMRDDKGGMAGPGETIEFTGDGAPAFEGQPDHVKFITINDFGGDATSEFKAKRSLLPDTSQ
ncbi:MULTISPECIES: molecular chaperone [unclassified Cupriavidus]|uniref:fimbrial biogenesis chaperone n=1 Tax=unclassified Cupriavidus TaxID=2640874 RepID=UPI0010F9C384|nr:MULTISPECIES: fimbria/pilus periplasmic chaperone [unclassified Cupriavidus]MWL86410.1 fimbria/pilus periplasmic chaperone [Cupriavidus sp. SW-Y-13]